MVPLLWPTVTGQSRLWKMNARLPIKIACHSERPCHSLLAEPKKRERYFSVPFSDLFLILFASNVSHSLIWIILHIMCSDWLQHSHYCIYYIFRNLQRLKELHSCGQMPFSLCILFETAWSQNSIYSAQKDTCQPIKVQDKYMIMG